MPGKPQYVSFEHLLGVYAEKVVPQTPDRAKKWSKNPFK